MSTAPLTVFYDGTCPTCRADVRGYLKLAARYNVESLIWCDLSGSPETLSEHGLSPDDAGMLAAHGLTPDEAGALAAHGLLEDETSLRIYAKSADGTLTSGYDAMIAIWQHIPHNHWFLRMACWPVVYPASKYLTDKVVSPLRVRFNKRLEPGAR